MDHRPLPFMDVAMKWIYKNLFKGFLFENETAGNGFFQPTYGANISSIIYLASRDKICIIISLFISGGKCATVVTLNCICAM